MLVLRRQVRTIGRMITVVIMTIMMSRLFFISLHLLCDRHCQGVDGYSERNRTFLEQMLIFNIPVKLTLVYGILCTSFMKKIDIKIPP